MKKIGIIIAFAAISIFFLVGKTNSKLQAYYSGDAVNFNNTVVFTSTNSGKLEVFQMENNVISKTQELYNYNGVFNINDSFADAKLSIENGHLYVYAVSQYTLYKYDISSLTNAQLVKKSSNTYWEWYQRVDRLGDNIATISEKGIKIFNSDLQVIDSYNFAVGNPYSIRSNASQQYIFAIDNDKIKVYDRNSRNIVREIPFNFVYKSNNHRAYYDILRNEIYAIDDSYTRKFDLSGNQLATFKHLEQPGYEVDSTYGNPYFYFSNGMGVVKMTKDNFKVAKYTFTNEIGGPQGWAMGLKVVNTDNGDVIVVFNGSNIILLDQNLKKIDSIKSTVTTVNNSANENLFLILNHDLSLGGSPLTVSGGGFWSQEPLTITLGDGNFSAQANSSGRFSKEIITPSLRMGRYDVKVTGVNSGLTYSTSIEIR